MSTSRLEASLAGIFSAVDRPSLLTYPISNLGEHEETTTGSSLQRHAGYDKVRLKQPESLGQAHTAQEPS